MLTAFIFITGTFNLLAAVLILWFSLHRPHRNSHQHQARAHYLCMQLLEIEKMTNNYQKIEAYNQWRQELQAYGEYCQMATQPSQRKQQLHVI
jgi:hypothetical protein